MGLALAMTAATAAYLASRPAVPQVAVGSLAAAAAPTAAPIVGADQYETSRLVATQYFPGVNIIGVASGTVFPDGLTGGAHIARLGGPLVLVDPGVLPAPTNTYLLANNATITSGSLYGGPVAAVANVSLAARHSMTGLTM